MKKKTKQLSESEVEQLGCLLRRAVDNGQFGLVAARPFPKGYNWRAAGFGFNDMLNGPTSFSDELIVCESERASDDESALPRFELEVYVPQQTLSFLNSDQF